MPIIDSAFEHLDRFDRAVLKGFERVGLGGQFDQMGFNNHATGITANMPEQIVLISGADFSGV